MSRRVLLFTALASLGGCASPKPPASGPDRPLVASNWSIPFDGSGSSPVLSDSTLFVGSADGFLYALNAASGAMRWRFETGKQNPGEIRRVDRTPAVENGTVYFVSGDKSLYAVDAATGVERWSYLAGPASPRSGGAPSDPPIIRRGLIYFVTEEGLHAVDAASGRRKWLFETLTEFPSGLRRVPSRPVMSAEGGTIFVTAWPLPAGGSRSSVYAVDAATGSAKWQYMVHGVRISPAVAADGLVLFSAEEDSLNSRGRGPLETAYALDTATGRLRWRLNATDGFGSSASALMVAGTSVAFLTGTTLTNLELATGRMTWMQAASGVLPGPRVDVRHVYMLTRSTTLDSPITLLHSIDVAEGLETWSRRLSEGERLAEASGGVLYTDHQALDAATGKTLWSFRGSARESTRLVAGGRVFLIAETTQRAGTARVDRGHLRAIGTRTGKR